MRGRPKLKVEDRRRFFGITLSPENAELLKMVDGNRSNLMDIVIERVLTPEMIRKFNKSPAKFAESLSPFGK